MVPIFCLGFNVLNKLINHNNLYTVPTQENIQIISSHTLLDEWQPTNTGIKVKGAMRFGTFKSIDFKKNWYVKVPMVPRSLML